MIPVEEIRGGNPGNLLLPIFAILHVKGLLSEDEYNSIRESMQPGKRMDETGLLLWDIVNKHKEAQL